MHQPRSTQCSKCHCAGKYCVSAFSGQTDHKSDHGCDSDAKSLCSNLGQEIFGQDRFIHRSWFFIHYFLGMRFQSKGNSRKTVCQKVDKQQMHRCKRNRKSCDGRIQYRKDRSKVTGKQELDRVLNVLVNISSVLYCFDDCCKVIICQYHRSSIL